MRCWVGGDKFYFYAVIPAQAGIQLECSACWEDSGVTLRCPSGVIHVILDDLICQKWVPGSRLREPEDDGVI